MNIIGSEEIETISDTLLIAIIDDSIRCVEEINQKTAIKKENITILFSEQIITTIKTYNPHTSVEGLKQIIKDREGYE